eukprot:2467947-Ditylum_brightwellii.AAC.1
MSFSTWRKCLEVGHMHCHAGYEQSTTSCMNAVEDHNKVLMDVFESLGLSNSTLEQLNLVRLYLGLITLADVTNDKGKHIFCWVLSGTAHGRPTIL